MTQVLRAGGRDPVVLLVEDNEDHAFFTREVFDEAAPGVALHHVTDGEKCMAFLRRQPPYGDAPVPDLILLDLNMPRMDGYEVMQQIAADPALRSLPVVVLTTSSEQTDVKRMYDLRCSSYIAKSVDLDEFSRAVVKLTQYWFGLVALPARVR